MTVHLFCFVSGKGNHTVFCAQNLGPLTRGRWLWVHPCHGQEVLTSEKLCGAEFHLKRLSLVISTDNSVGRRITAQPFLAEDPAQVPEQAWCGERVSSQTQASDAPDAPDAGGAAS